MASYVFDIGFDWNATVSSSNQLPLFIGLVDLASPDQFAVGSGNIAYDVFRRQDSVSLNLFNLTNGANLSTYSVTGGSIAFQSAPIDRQVAQSPTNYGSVTINSLGEATRLGGSLIFTAGSSFPVWLDIGSVTIDSLGSFLFTISLSIQGPGGETRSFAIDPEMIVQATPPPIDTQESLESSAASR